MLSVFLNNHHTEHQYTSSRNAPLEPEFWIIFLWGLIMREQQLAGWHIKEFISHVHKKNWNRTETEQWLRPRGFFFRMDFILRNPFFVFHVHDTSPVSSLKTAEDPSHQRCFASCSKDFAWTTAARTLRQPFFYFSKKCRATCRQREREREAKSQVQFVEEKSISWRAGLQSVSLFVCCPRGWQQNPGSRWRISVRVRLILDALCSRVSSRGSEEGGRQGVTWNKWACFYRGWHKDHNIY